ncbi:MAG: glycosyltransferase family 2 protein [Ignavibacteriaceae bacterium]
MSDTNNLSIVICTRNRPVNLRICIQSIARQNIKLKKNIEVIIIDDGELSDVFLNDSKLILSDFKFKYVKKEMPGLLLSRIKAISLAESDIILFVDDDVELDENYLEILEKTYFENTDAAGVSGIDILMDKPNLPAKLYHQIFFLKSNSPGKLSLTGYGDSMQYWSCRSKNFYSEFLSGCNMSFKRKALLNVQPLSWLNNYSLGEDVYLSYAAGLYGNLIINPNLKVKHHQSPIARDKIGIVAFNDVVNHHQLLKIKKEKKWKLILQGWTVFGILLKSLCMFKFKEIKGYLRGVIFLLNPKHQN